MTNYIEPLKLHVYLDRCDELIGNLLKRKNITRAEALDLQNKVYAYDDLVAGMSWLTRKYDELNIN